MEKILIADDNLQITKIISEFVRNAGFDPVIASDGKEALDLFHKEKFAVILLDVMMPLMDGFETLRQIRKNKKSVDIIMVTAANDRASLEEALHLGVVDYLVKPFTYDRFRIALDKYVSQVAALKDLDTLNQKNIDFIIENAHKKSEELYPKGIQEKTLQTILDEMKRNSSKWMTGDEIAERIGLTGVTVRRYLNHLTEKGILLSEIDYETGGRPCMRYRVSE